MSESTPKDSLKNIPLLSIYTDNNKTIWAIGGEKEGTGKSFLSANLALHLSRMGEDVVLIDANLAGPNLHTFLGIREPEIELEDSSDRKTSDLEHTMVSTSIDRLKLARGADNILFNSSMDYHKKVKLIKHIKAFNTKRVIIDLGTGALNNSVDFFLLSNPGILVLNPEPTSIESAYYFLKTCIIRILKLYIQHFKIQDLIKAIADKIQNTSESIYSFFSEVISYDKFYADLLYKALTTFNPCLVINKARDEKDFLLGQSIVNVVSKYLVISVNFLGVIPYDEKVPLSLKYNKPFIDIFANAQVTHTIRNISDKLTGLNDS